jgi:hypothetical protein
VLAVVALLGVAAAPLPGPPASASCAAPYLDVARSSELERGASRTVEGRGFVDGCQDSEACSVGCASCESDDPAETPMEGVGLRLVQGQRSWLLDVADAGTAADGELGLVAWTFEVPAAARPGRARLVPDGGEAVLVRVGR